MRIDKLNSVSSYSTALPEKLVKNNPSEEKKLPTTDRVEVRNKPSTDELSAKIKENIIKSDKQQTSAEKLEAIKQKIQQNQYHVDTTDIVKSIL